MFRVSTLVLCVPLLALNGCWNEEGSLEDPLANADAGLNVADPGPSRPSRDDAGKASDEDADEEEPSGDLADGSVGQGEDADVRDFDATEPDPAEPPDAGEHDDPADAGHPTDAGHAIDAGTPRDAGGLLDAGVDASLTDAGKPYTGYDSGSKVPVTVEFDPGAVADASFTAVFAILQSRCRSCHTSTFNYSLDLSARQVAHEELVSGPNAGAAEFISCQAPGIFRVIPKDPGNSLLIQKLFNVQHCGDRMPTNGTMSLSERAVIWTWIAQGALNN